MSDGRYNGWTNYETWVVTLWMDNEEGSQDALLAEECWQEAGRRPHPIWTREQAATYALEDAIREEMLDAMPDLGCSMWADLLGAALGSVNWREIAEHYIADLDKAEEAEAEA